MFSLNSKDFHCENIIASGYSPIPIDLETFVHVVVDEIDNDNIIFGVNRVIQDSVIGTSLLPTLLPNMNTEEVIEVGAMGKAEKQSSPFKTQIIKNIDTDDVQIEFVNKGIKLVDLRAYLDKSLNSNILHHLLLLPYKFLYNSIYFNR